MSPCRGPSPQRISRRRHGQLQMTAQHAVTGMEQCTRLRKSPMLSAALMGSEMQSRQRLAMVTTDPQMSCSLTAR